VVVCDRREIKSFLCISWESSEQNFIMSDAAAAAPVKAAKRKSAGKAKKPSSHPKYSKMVQDALKALKVRWNSLIQFCDLLS